MKNIAIYGLVIVTIFTMAYGKESPVMSIATADYVSDNKECFHEFMEHEWEREAVESIGEITGEEVIKVSQLGGKLVYTTDFDMDVVVYRHPENDYIFTGRSFGNEAGYIIVSDYEVDIYFDYDIFNEDIYFDVNIYFIETYRVLDIFAYGDYIYYIWLGSHGWFGGIKRLAYVDGRWCHDEEFRQKNAEVASMSYIGSDYSVVRQAYVDGDETYIVSSRYIYSFDGIELTPVLDISLGSDAYSVYSATKIGDSFYIGAKGYILEVNIVTGEEYVWTKIPCSESVCSPKTGDDFSLLFVIVLSAAFFGAMKLTRRSPRYSKNS